MILRRVDVVERAERIRNSEFEDVRAGEHLAHADISLERECGKPQALVKDHGRRATTAPDRDNRRRAGLAAARDDLVDQSRGHTGDVAEEDERGVQALVERTQADLERAR